MPDEEGFNPSKFFETLRKSASVKAGAIMFGQAQIAYYDTLKEHMSEEQAFNLLAHTTETLVKNLLAAAPGVLEVLLKAAATWEAFQTAIADREKLFGTDKEVPGSAKPE